MGNKIVKVLANIKNCYSKCQKWHIFAVCKMIFFISVSDSMIFLLRWLF